MTFPYYDIIDFPSIPDELILGLEQIYELDNTFIDQNNKWEYAAFSPNKYLKEYLQDMFDEEIVSKYQVIRKDLPVHVDYKITGVKYNYIISTGGNNVKTRWYDNLEKPRTIIHEVISKPLQWHSLNIEIPHNVCNVTSPRLSVVIRSLSGDPLQLKNKS